MDMPEQEIIRRSLGDTIEGVDNEVEVIRVNVLMSGVVDTPIHAGRREEMKAWAEKDLPTRRFGLPEDIAHAIEFLMTNPTR